MALYQPRPSLREAFSSRAVPADCHWDHKYLHHGEHVVRIMIAGQVLQSRLTGAQSEYPDVAKLSLVTAAWDAREIRKVLNVYSQGVEGKGVSRNSVFDDAEQ